MKSSLLLFFLSLTLMAGKGDFSVVEQEFTIDPYEIILGNAESRTWQKVTLTGSKEKNLNCYRYIYFKTNTWIAFANVVEQARKENLSLNFSTAHLSETEQGHAVDAQNFSQVWRLNQQQVDSQWKEMSVEDFRKYYTVQYGSTCWPFSLCEPLITKYRFSNYSRSYRFYASHIDDLPDSWQPLLEKIELLKPDDIIYVSKYLSSLAGFWEILKTIPGERLFRLAASPESETEKLVNE